MSSYVYFKPYFEAANKILAGVPIKNLEEIRLECNKKFLENHIHYGYESKFIVSSFVADAENRILLGEDPKKIYLFNEDPKSFRANCIKILEEVIKEYLI